MDSGIVRSHNLDEYLCRAMKLSILIPHSDRPQIALKSLRLAVTYIGESWIDIPYNNGISKRSYKDFEIIGYHSQETSGIKRNILTKESSGEYICFIDDDDQVSLDYISSLLNHIGKADVISFNLRFLLDGKQTEIWKYLPVPNARRSSTMCINHLCAWRRDIATKVAWCPLLGYADDRLWYEPLYHAGLVKTTLHIDSFLYTYLYSRQGTLNQKTDQVKFGKNYMSKGIKCYKDGDKILIQVPHPAQLLVRDNMNREFAYNPMDLNYYHTVGP